MPQSLQVITLEIDGTPMTPTGTVLAMGTVSLHATVRRVSFARRASNLMAGDTNARDDVFVHDLATGFTERVSKAWNGTQATHDGSDPVISAGAGLAHASNAPTFAIGP